jgi:4-hydroxyproline epimerase
MGGFPNLGDGTLAERLEYFRSEHDRFRSAVVCEPRGSDVIVGALHCKPTDPTCAAAVIFFNNVGYLGMCVHGTIGVIATLAYVKRLQPGEHRIETPVGTVTAALHKSGEVTVTNVPSYRLATRVPVEVPGFGKFCGDVAWGGNWFFLVEEHDFDLTLQNANTLTTFTWAVRQALRTSGITGKHGQEIDHIELFGPPLSPGAHSKNFVLCPGKAYDRSPCGTGTSAKMACLYADGKLREGEVWVQESILGSTFEGSIRICDERLYPSIKGAAFVNAETTMVLNPLDPFCMGLQV